MGINRGGISRGALSLGMGLGLKSIVSGGGAVPFNPLDRESLFAFYLASEEIAASPVSLWGDKTSNNYNLPQALEASRPLWNGTEVIFDGVDDYMVVDPNLAILPNNENTCIIIGKTDKFGNVSGGDRQNLFLGENTGFYSLSFFPEPCFFNGSLDGRSIVDTIIPDDYFIMVGRYKDGQIICHFNGIVGSIKTGANVTVGDINLGRNPITGGYKYDGLFEAILFYNEGLPDDYLNQVTDYFINLFDIPNALPSPNIPESLKTASSIVTFGDSLTFGSGATKNYSQYINLATNIPVTNKGIGGTPIQNSNLDSGSPKSGNGRDRYIADLTGANKKDFCIIMYGTNDFGWSEAEWTLENFVNDYQEVITGLLANGYTNNDICLCSPPWIPDNGYDFNGDFNGANRAEHEAHVSAVRQLSIDNNLYYADTYAATRDNGGLSLMSADNLHLNKAGHAVLATTILNCKKV